MIHPDRTVFDDAGAAASSFAQVPAACTLDLLAQTAQETPDASAITLLAQADPDSPTQVVSYADLHARTVQVANLLRRHGVQRSDAVAVLMPLVPEALMAIFGASTAGIAMPINFLLSAEHIAGMLDSVRCRVLVAYGDDDEFGIWRKALEVREKSASPLKILKVGGEVSADDPDTLAFAQAVAAESSSLSFERPGPSDIAAYFHTGGTTGLPKLARHTQRNQVFAAWASVHINGYSQGSCTLGGMPLFHVAGSLLLSLAIFSAGSHLVLLTRTGLRNKQVIANYWRLVDRYKPRIIGFPPTSLMAVADVPVGDSDISSVVFCSSGGASLPVEAASRFETTLGIPIREAYGMTETAGLIAYTPCFTERRRGSVGVAVPGMEVRIVAEGADPDTAASLGPGERGVIVARGPNVFAGYVDASMNAGMLSVGGWVLSGDLGHMDAEGYVFVTGRAKDLIIRGSHNIDPIDIESAAAACPAVLQCAAVGQPDSYAGEVPVLYVTLKPSATMSSEEILQFVGERVSEGPARPRHVFIVDELPTTPVGKVFKPALRRDAAQRVVCAELDGQKMTASVTMVEDPRRGLVANIRLPAADAGAQERIRQALARYSFACDIETGVTGAQAT